MRPQEAIDIIASAKASNAKLREITDLLITNTDRSPRVIWNLQDLGESVVTSMEKLASSIGIAYIEDNFTDDERDAYIKELLGLIEERSRIFEDIVKEIESAS